MTIFFPADAENWKKKGLHREKKPAANQMGRSWFFGFSMGPRRDDGHCAESNAMQEIQMPEYTDSSLPESGDSLLYTFDVNEEWTLVESGKGTVVYAYGRADMTALQQGESTSSLTTQMTMKSITNAEYADIDDIHITITGYAMGTEGMSTIPTDAWNESKTIGNIQ